MSYKDLINQAINCLEKYAEAEIKCHNEDNENTDDVLNKIIKEVAFYCNSEARHEKLDNKFKDCLEMMKNADSAEKASQICKILENVWREPWQCVPTEDDRYKKIVDLQEHLGDDSLVVVKSTQNFTDPLSRQRMVHPVKNKQCGHSYEKSVALQVIKRNPHTRCPMVGCSAFIEAKNLVPDKELEQQLAATPAVDEEDPDWDNSQLVALD